VRNLVWDGPGAPAHPEFPVDKGLTGAAIAQGRTINVPDVSKDPCYLTALSTTRSEIIVPIFDEQGSVIVGTIDVESELADAFGPEVQRTLESCASVIRPLWGEV
jgi:putative methionine-R-sulfoxide reductase with GAF domain